MTSQSAPRVCLLATPETTASVLYGLYDVLSATGRIWSQITGEPELGTAMTVEIVSPGKGLFRCHGGVPVEPHASLKERPESDLIIVPDLAVPVDLDPGEVWSEEADWLRKSHDRGALVASVCTGAILLAKAGLLEQHSATTHWAYKNLFDTHFPQVKLNLKQILEPTLPEARIVTSGGATSWEDLALYLISRFCGEAEALRIAKTFLIGDRSEGQLPYAAMAKPRIHDDRIVADCQVWIAEAYTAPNPVRRMVERSGLPERSFKRRFQSATGFTPVAYVQTLRIEEAKQMLETTDLPTDQIGAEVGYEDPAFFRRLFKRQTGITQSRYRQRFRRINREL